MSIDGNTQVNKMFVPSKPVGYWVLGGNFHIEIMHRPTDEQIKNTEEMFGWEWKERE